MWAWPWPYMFVFCFLQPWMTVKNHRFLRFIHNNNNHYPHHHQLLQTGFLRVYCTSLIILEIILPEERAFIIGFSCTVWTKMRSLAGSLADGVLADAI